MNQREIGELRRRLKPDKNAITKIYGCYVNSNKQVISYLDASLGVMPQDEAEKYLTLLRRTLTGQLQKNLIDIVFSTRQVADSEEHRLLSALRQTELKDEQVRRQFYDQVIQALDMDERNYLILLAHDTYDVPYRGRDDQDQADASDQVFSYVLCAICPVKDSKAELGYFPGENEFHSRSAGQVVAPPELGFLFPAFDNRSANLYNALYYTRQTDLIHQEFIDALFRTEPPMSADEQKETFHTALAESLDGACSMEVVRAVHQQLRDKLLQHKEERDPEAPSISPKEVDAILHNCGVEEEKVQAFHKSCAAQFGEGVPLNPANLINSGRFEIKTENATILIDPDYSYLVETRKINGRTYLLLPADGMEVNGLAVDLRDHQPG
ncbi:DUF4317 domain-containing protein [Pseudoflavonifractor phocaeensis]|uniref:DUF4317 domain-containing protein n=1 Tax=Pseudoflavonifractor phocaeensis TaxID=1870988 RepID=UPI001958F681|nr:DUF4317 domain-containing protein [Pseudoflavonifractor phocaeensis]MBM6886628.1 DUF4317 domain-containing protein [Pseudoflavonifractor phocaeensis]